MSGRQVPRRQATAGGIPVVPGVQTAIPAVAVHYAHGTSVAIGAGRRKRSAPAPASLLPLMSYRAE